MDFFSPQKDAEIRYHEEIPSGKHTKNYGKSPFLMGKSTISMAIFNSYVKLPEGNQQWGFKILTITGISQ